MQRGACPVNSNGNLLLTATHGSLSLTVGGAAPPPRVVGNVRPPLCDVFSAILSALIESPPPPPPPPLVSQGGGRAHRGRGRGQPNGLLPGGPDHRRQWVMSAGACLFGRPGAICATSSALGSAPMSAKPTHSSPPCAGRARQYATRSAGAGATSGKWRTVLQRCELHGAPSCAQCAGHRGVRHFCSPSPVTTGAIRLDGRGLLTMPLDIWHHLLRLRAYGEERLARRQKRQKSRESETTGGEEMLQGMRPRTTAGATPEAMPIQRRGRASRATLCHRLLCQASAGG